MLTFVNNLYFQKCIFRKKYLTHFNYKFKIQHIVDDLIENWSHETHRITIESFKRKTDYIILFHIGNWDEEKYFWKTAISAKHNEHKSFQQLVSLFSVFKNFAIQHTSKHLKESVISDLHNP